MARNMAAMGAETILVGVVGTDQAATDLATRLRATPTIDARLIADSSRPTSVKTRYIADGQQVMRADHENRSPLRADVETLLLHEFSSMISEASIVVLSDYAKGVISERVAREAIDLARLLGKTVIVDPKCKYFDKYRGSTIITPNRLELETATGRDCGTDMQVTEASRVILDAGVCDTLLVTRGKNGISVIEKGGESTHLPTAAREVFDVSGAGDTALAALALALAARASVVAAALLANIAAGIVVGKRGTATVTTGELMAAVTSFDSRTDAQKVFAAGSVLRLVRSWREQGLKVAFTNGCFDLLHPGHISLLEQARCQADRLIVGLNSDQSVRRLKGSGRPLQSEVVRATVLAAVCFVDAVVIFDQDTPLHLIDSLEPDVLVKGGDYTIETVVGADAVLARGGKVLLVELMQGHSTTNTTRRFMGREDFKWRESRSDS